MLERDLARVKVSASRIATVAANEWKDDGDKVIPVKQWLEERRFLQVNKCFPNSHLQLDDYVPNMHINLLCKQ